MKTVINQTWRDGRAVWQVFSQISPPRDRPASGPAAYEYDATEAARRGQDRARRGELVGGYAGTLSYWGGIQMSGRLPDGTPWDSDWSLPWLSRIDTREYATREDAMRDAAGREASASTA